MQAKAQSRKRDTRIRRARELRRAMTDAERKLWWYLRQLPADMSHFRRQATIGPYFVNFACHQKRIVIEVDGGQHEHSDRVAADAKRTAYLNAEGYRVLRFWNNEVLKETEGVLTVIYGAIRGDAEAEPPTPDPSPPRAARVGGGNGEAAAFLPQMKRKHRRGPTLRVETEGDA